MRSIRSLALASAVIMLLPVALSAQVASRPFEDAWFWGLKAGGVDVSNGAAGGSTVAPTVGGEWMMTRTHGGLYMSLSQAFLSANVLTAPDPNDPTDSAHVASIKGLRRFDLALMGFPGEHFRFHPYFGGGFSFSEVGSATPEGKFRTQEQLDFASSVLQSTRASIAPYGIVGGQYALRNRPMSLFGQLTVTSLQNNFVLYNGQAFSIGFEAGLRYNIGSSIDKDDSRAR